APPELQRHSRPRDRAGVVEWAPPCVGTRVCGRRTADLFAGGPLQEPPESQLGKVTVAQSEIRVGVERSGAGEQARVPGEEQERLLTAHAAAERVDTSRVDVEPRHLPAQDLRHPG